MEENALLILKGISAMLFAISAIFFLIQKDYSNWAIYMCLMMLVLADGTGSINWDW